MKRAFLVLSFFCILVHGMAKETNETRLVVYDEQAVLKRYKNLQKLTSIPPSYKDAIKRAGYYEKDINIYTADKAQKIIERVGNNIILNNDLFFTLTEEVQAGYICCELQWEKVYKEICQAHEQQ